MTRIHISPEIRALIKTFAAAEGHNNLSAALSTIVHFGVPLLISRGIQERYSGALKQLSDQAPPAPEPLVPPVTSCFELPPTQEERDEVIDRLAHLLEEF